MVGNGRARRVGVLAAIGCLVGAALAAPADAATVGWQPQPTPGIFGDVVLQSAVALSASDVWAVGQTRADIAGTFEWRAVALHWDGAGWTRANTPDRETAPAQDFLFGVSATATDDVWAVGSAGRPAGGGSGDATLVLHWNGQQWQLVTSPDPAASDAFVAGSSPRPGNLWAVGDKADPSVGAFVPLVEHLRNGVWQELTYASAIQHCAVADTVLTSVDAVGASDVYVGGSCTVFGHTRGIVAHWDGSIWLDSVLADPNTEITGLGGGRSGGEVWAVGDTVPYGPTDTIRGIAYHGRGSTWTAALMPRSPGVLRTIDGVGVGSGPQPAVYAVGRTFSDAAHYQGLIYSWNGTGWTREPIESTQTELLYGAAVAPNGSAWAVGFHFGPNGDQQSILRRTRG